MDKEQIAVIETITNSASKSKSTYTTFFNFSFATFIAYRIAVIFLLMIVAACGMSIHTLWSLVIAVVAIARFLKEIAMFGGTIKDIYTCLESLGVKKDNLFTYLKTNGTMTLRTVEDIHDEGTAERGDTEG